MSEQALKDIKILDFSRVIAGPLLSMYLAQYGATVIKIESKSNPGTLRVSAPYKDFQPGLNRSGYFSTYNCNKYSMSLDLKHPRSMEVIKRLLGWCDIVLENFAPGTMKKFNLDYQQLKKIKPDLIMISSSNQGQTGPDAHFAGYGYMLQALCGFTALTGYSNEQISQPFGGLTDFVSPGLGATALLSAIEFRRRTGQGMYLDISQYECGLFLLSPLLLDFNINGNEFRRNGNRCDYASPHGAYPCKGEDRWCVISIESQEDWIALCRAVDNPEMANDRRYKNLEKRKENEDLLDKEIAKWTKTKTSEEVMSALQDCGIAAGVVQNPADLFNDPQILHRGHFKVLEHPEMGCHSYEKAPFQLSETPADISMPAPCLGEHNEYICREILGLEDEDFIQLLQEGVFQ